MEDNVTSDAVKDHPAGTGRNGKRVIVGVAAVAAVVAGRGWRVRIQGVREPSGVGGAPGVPVRPSRTWVRR